MQRGCQTVPDKGLDTGINKVNPREFYMKNDQDSSRYSRRALAFLAAGVIVFLGAATAVILTLPPRVPSGKALAELPPLPEEDTQGAASADLVCPKLAEDDTYRGKNKLFKYIIPGKDGWLFRTVDFRQDFHFSDKALKAFETINTALKAQGVDLVILLQPPRGIFAPGRTDPVVWPKGYDPETARRSYRDQLQRLRDLGLAVVDLSDIPSDAPYFLKADPHWSLTGARMSAQKTAELIRALPGYDSIEKKPFTTRIVGRQKHERGDFEVFALKVCGVELPPIMVDIWETTAEAQEIDQANLFGDAAPPAIVALGTSNTENDKELNFVGSLKTLLSADIDNFALAGGGFGGSAVSYFASDSFRANKPKVVLWEFLAHHDFEDFPALRQIEGSVGWSCEKSETRATYTGGFSSLTPVAPEDSLSSTPPSERKMWEAETVLFEGLEKRISAGDSTFLSLEVTDPVERSVKVGVLYSNGDAEEIDLTRSARAPNNGKYYLSFDSSEGVFPLLVQLSSNIPTGDISAKICSRSGSTLARKD
jgi:alginate biosynthesis protein AlgX